ncbi:MAG: globin domain-containing protein [Phycisphaerales bacterium]
MPLTPVQIERLNMNLSLVESQIEKLVAAFYDKLFQAAPEVRALFPDDPGTQRSDLTGALLLVAKNIQDLENLGDPLRQIGESNTLIAELGAHYPLVRDCMLKAVAQVSGYTWTPNLEQDWTLVLDTVAGHIIEGAGIDRTRAA